MKFKKLLKLTNPKDIKDEWSRIYDKDLSIDLFTDLKERLLNKELKKSSGVITVEKGSSYNKPDKTVYNVQLWEGKDVYGISLWDWGACLNTIVCLEDIPRKTAVSCILYEMTWHGIFEQDVKDVASQLEERVEKIKSGEAEMYTHEEFMKMLGED